MTATDSARRAGFLVQLAVSGESVVLPNGQTVQALIDRNVISGARRAGLPDYTTKATAAVEIATPTVIPKANEYLSRDDGSGVRYRIIEVLVETTYSVRLKCQPFSSQAAA